MPRTAPVPNMIAIPGMNPGLFVLGGGGDGGGSGAGDGKGKGGKQGANGKNGGNDANGGGKGAGACGAGGPGSCNTCGHNVSAGDPVDVASGDVFTVPKTDLFLPGIFNLDIRRSYSAEQREIDVGMGFGWTHSLAWSIHERRRRLVVSSGDGRVQSAPRPTAEGGEVYVGAWGIYRGPGFYMIRPGNEFVHFFEPDPDRPSYFRLAGVRYRNWGHVSLQYEGGRLARAVDTVGRVILFSSNASGRIESIAVPDSQGRALVFANYAYDNAGNLVAASDADGNTTRYSYDEEHLLTRLHYPSGLVIHYRYDNRGRCVETWGTYDGPDPALAEGLPTQLADGKTKVLGIFHTKLGFEKEVTYVDDTIRTRRFEHAAVSTITKAVGGRGGVTTRELDGEGRVVSQTDPTGATWSYEYDVMGEIVRETSPDGGSLSIERLAGRPVAVTDAEGRTRTIGRDAYGNVDSTTDQAGGKCIYIRDARGLVTQMVDEHQGEHRYEHDAHANVIAYVDPNGSRWEMQYDFWGRRTHDRDPLGNQRSYTHSLAGNLTSVTDALGRATQYRYDVMGNLAAAMFPDGTTTWAEWGGLNWLANIHYADGSTVRLRYNHEGWIKYIETALGDRHTFELNTDGQLIGETNPWGEEVRFERDGLGRVVAYTNPDGRVDIKRSATGLILEERHEDGEGSSFEYNLRGELVAAESDGVKYSWDLDPLGRVLRETSIVDGATYRVDSKRAPDGQREALRTSLGHDVLLRRDPRGLVSELWSKNQRVLALQRDRRGVIAREELEGGGAIVDSYDAAGALRRREVHSADRRARDGTPERLARDPSTWDVLYDYSAAKELIKVTPAAGDEVVLEYDLRRRLIRRSAAKIDEHFRADGNDNYYERALDGSTVRSYERGDRLRQRGQMTYEYDARGRLVERREPSIAGDRVTRYRWNIRSLLSAVELPDGATLRFRYDAFARRVAKQVEVDGEVRSRHHYVWDQASLVHDVELDARGAPDEVLTYLYLEDNDADAVAQRTQRGDQASRDGSGWQYFVGDITQTPEGLVDGRGEVLGRMLRTAFGRVTTLAGARATTLVRMPGQTEDPETGLHYNRYRYYDPDAGRYISPDPIGLLGGWNLYRYGLNPIGWIDPMGWQNTNYGRVSEPNPPPGAVPFNPALSQGGTGFYDSSYQGCPYNMQNYRNPYPQSHCEQKFSRDLINQFGGQQAAGRSFQMDGIHPPCPNCHAAMSRAAQQTGANVTYTWGNGNAITYTGGTGAVNPNNVQGEQAQYLMNNGYQNMQLNQNFNFNANAPRGTSAQNYWGFTPGAGSQTAYNDLMNPRRTV